MGGLWQSNTTLWALLGVPSSLLPPPPPHHLTQGLYSRVGWRVMDFIVLNVFVVPCMDSNCVKLEDGKWYCLMSPDSQSIKHSHNLMDWLWFVFLITMHDVFSPSPHLKCIVLDIMCININNSAHSTYMMTSHLIAKECMTWVFSAAGPTLIAIWKKRQQDLSLGSMCEVPSIFQHELLHVLVYQH